jgi:hypothetical protein
MKVSWGWCPYHGLRGELKLIENKKDVNYKKDFSNIYSKRIIEEMQQEDLLVHWTEFLV